MNHLATTPTKGITPTLATSTEAVAIELHQLAHNALASAAWHVDRMLNRTLTTP